MRKLRIYLDTSVINFLFADDAPEFKKATVEFFDRFASRYDLHISGVVLAEIDATPDVDHRAALRSVPETRGVTLLPDDMEDEVARLADLYIARGVIPASKQADALHVAYATVYGLDVILSWNFQHLANVRKETAIMAINLEEGYTKPLRLLSPLEMYDE